MTPFLPGHPGRRDPDAGDTLVEILISVAILGIVVAALLTGFLTSISTSSVYRSMADADTVLRTAVDSVTTEMQQQPAGAFACPVPPAVLAVTGLPAGYTSQISSVTYWVGGVAQASCAPYVPRLVTVAVTFTSQTGGAASTTRATFMVNDPQAPPVHVGDTASRLVFLSSGGPNEATAGSSIPNQPLVAVEDSTGQIVTTDLSPVSLSITSGPPGARLANCTGSEFYGVVNFSGCEIDLAGSGYTLTATNGRLTSAQSPSFSVSPGPPTNMVFTRSPATNPGDQAATGGRVFDQQPEVTLRDAYGNTASRDTSTVTLAITSGTGAAGAVLGCKPANDQQAVVNGVASFTGCAIDKAASSYTLTATDGTLTSATSTVFKIGVGPAAKLAFSTQPGGTITRGVAFPTQPAVTVEDAGGNTVTTASSTVQLAITANTGTAGAKLTCSPSNDQRRAQGGVAAFARCNIDQTGDGYTLTATDSTLTAAVTQPFDVVVGAPSKLVFTAEPSGTNPAGRPFLTQPVVAVEDAAGNVVTTDNTTQVTLSLPGAGGATLTCQPGPLTLTVVAGVARYSNCEVDQVGSYRLRASAQKLTYGTSSQFTVG